MIWSEKRHQARRDSWKVEFILPTQTRENPLQMNYSSARRWVESTDDLSHMPHTKMEKDAGCRPSASFRGSTGNCRPFLLLSLFQQIGGGRKGAWSDGIPPEPMLGNMSRRKKTNSPLLRLRTGGRSPWSFTHAPDQVAPRLGSENGTMFASSNLGQVASSKAELTVNLLANVLVVAWI